jgi:hypothetical protein
VNLLNKVTFKYSQNSLVSKTEKSLRTQKEMANNVGTKTEYELFMPPPKKAIL